MHIELTDGWDGKTIKKTDVPDREYAVFWIQVVAPDPEHMRNLWTHTRLDEAMEREIIDYGSHRYFGRLTDLNEQGESK